MKTTLHIVLLATCLALPAALYSTTADFNSAESSNTADYDNAFDLMKDFLDLKVKKDKPMNYWVGQFIALIRQQDRARQRELRPFLKELHTALATRSPLNIGMAFKKHKEQFGEPELKKYIEDRLNQPNGLTTIANILKARLAV